MNDEMKAESKETDVETAKLLYVAMTSLEKIFRQSETADGISTVSNAA